MFSVIIVIIIHSDCGGRDKCVAIRIPPKPALQQNHRGLTVALIPFVSPSYCNYLVTLMRQACSVG